MSLGNKIEPTTKLTAISSSSLKTFATCPRKYYYNYVRNLVGKGYHVPFLVGHCLHVFLENFYQGKKLSACRVAVRKEFDLATKEIFVTPEGEMELEYQWALILGTMKGYYRTYKKERAKITDVQTETKFAIHLKRFDVWLVGTIDMLFKIDGKLHMMENKSVSGEEFVSQYVNGMAMNRQSQMYPIFVDRCLKKPLHSIVYNAIIKSRLRQKKTETFDEFIDRVAEDYITRAKEYFRRETIRFNKIHRDKVMKDIEGLLNQLWLIYECADSEEELLNPETWPRNTDNCFAYFTRCPYFDLCRFGEKPISLAKYKEREKRYDGKVIFEKGKSGKSKNAIIDQ